jgi:spore maturation protein CgeB
VDHRGLLSESFDDHEMATFTSLDELGSKIDHFLGAPQERDRMAHAARQRALADHTYQRRMADLVDFAAERTGLGSRPRQAPVLDQDFPPRLARELAELMERLGLPANAGFDDVVTAVRSQSGRLSDLDTAILFLDEWRKQYGRK